MVEVYLLYFLIIALWCKMCRKCLRFWKHWRVCICIVSLEKFMSCHFTSCHAYCVTKVSWHRTQIFAFYSVATFMNNVFFFFFLLPDAHPSIGSGPPRGKDLKERLLLRPHFTVCKCSDGSYNVKSIPFDQFRSLNDDSDVILRSLLLRPLKGTQTSA